MPRQLRGLNAERSATTWPPRTNSTSAAGLHLLMGTDFGERVSDMVDGLERGVIAPVHMIARIHHDGGLSAQ